MSALNNNDCTNARGIGAEQFVFVVSTKGWNVWTIYAERKNEKSFKWQNCQTNTHTDTHRLTNVEWHWMYAYWLLYLYVGMYWGIDVQFPLLSSNSVLGTFGLFGTKNNDMKFWNSKFFSPKSTTSSILLGPFLIRPDLFEPI